MNALFSSKIIFILLNISIIFICKSSQNTLASEYPLSLLSPEDFNIKNNTIKMFNKIDKIYAIITTILDQNNTPYTINCFIESQSDHLINVNPMHRLISIAFASKCEIDPYSDNIEVMSMAFLEKFTQGILIIYYNSLETKNIKSSFIPLEYIEPTQR